MLVSTIALPAALFAYVAIISYQNSFSLADERIERSLDVVGEHASKVFQSLNVTITGVASMVRGRSDDQVRRQKPDGGKRFSSSRTTRVSVHTSARFCKSWDTEFWLRRKVRALFY
jgi:hypothetical protein